MHSKMGVTPPPWNVRDGRFFFVPRANKQNLPHTLCELPDARGLHVTRSVLEYILHGMHAILDPLCAATAPYDATHDWAPCTTAKALVVILLHVVILLCLARARANAPNVMKKSVTQLANEVLMQGPPEAVGSSTSVNRGEGATAGLVHRR